MLICCIQMCFLSLSTVEFEALTSLYVIKHIDQSVSDVALTLIQAGQSASGPYVTLG